ncbi:hypothetical protein KP509_02G064000 [Ceratopteris richardii]|uniref:BZIP domain-containing protein n=1 Tax=Ceratopteris richardii TaxID=49495 RepID=A0A8T2V6L8_CERRI|nr:hypothetical protein KP509_02G064000 [Ceratopteris richardii]
MIGASLDRDAVASSLRLAVPRDQNSCSDFNGLAPAPSMQEDEGLSLLNDVDVFYFHPSLTNDNLSSVSLSDAVSLPELDGSMQEFDGYFCSWELEGSGIDGCKDKEVFCDAIVDNASFLGDGIQQIGGQFSSPELNESASFQINESASAEMPTDGNCMGDNMQSSAISALRESDVGCSFREKGFVLFSTEKDQSHYVHFSNKRKRGDTNSNTGGREKSGSRNDALGKRQQRLLRNRKLAFESRQRKKCYIKDLEKKCKILEEERNQLQQQVGFASAENAVLRKELSRVKKVRGKGVAEPAVLFWGKFIVLEMKLYLCSRGYPKVLKGYWE